MPSVWVVSYVEDFGETHIIAILASEEEAKALTNGCEEGPDNPNSNLWINKYEMGAPDGDVFRKMWRACLNLYSGEVSYTSVDYERHPSGWSSAFGMCANSCVSVDHAIEIARESRMEFLKKERG